MDELKAEILAVLKLSPISKIDKVTTIRADHAHVAERYELQLVDDVEEKKYQPRQGAGKAAWATQGTERSRAAGATQPRQRSRHP
jgi:hypothetical protein